MSNLRKQLEAARNDYRGVRYSGDLASEILGSDQKGVKTGRTGRIAWSIGLFAAAAAAIVLFLRPQTVDTTTQEKNSIAMVLNNATNEVTDVIATTQEAELTQVAWSDMPSLSVPAPSDLDTRGTDEMNMAPAAPDFSIAVPSFSLLEDQAQQQTQQQSSSANYQETVL